MSDSSNTVLKPGFTMTSEDFLLKGQSEGVFSANAGYFTDGDDHSLSQYVNGDLLPDEIYVNPRYLSYSNGGKTTLLGGVDDKVRIDRTIDEDNALTIKNVYYDRDGRVESLDVYMPITDLKVPVSYCQKKKDGDTFLIGDDFEEPEKVIVDASSPRHSSYKREQINDWHKANGTQGQTRFEVRGRVTDTRSA